MAITEISPAFACDRCGRSFSKLNPLSGHRTAHEKADAAAVAASPPDGWRIEAGAQGGWAWALRWKWNPEGGYLDGVPNQLHYDVARRCYWGRIDPANPAAVLVVAIGLLASKGIEVATVETLPARAPAPSPPPPPAELPKPIFVKAPAPQRRRVKRPAKRKPPPVVLVPCRACLPFPRMFDTKVWCDRCGRSGMVELAETGFDLLSPPGAGREDDPSSSSGPGPRRAVVDLRQPRPGRSPCPILPTSMSST